MPIFKRTSFRASRKVPARRSDAGSTNKSDLIDREALDPNVDISKTPLKLSLGGQTMLFQNGSWVSQSADGTLIGAPNQEEVNHLKTKLKATEEENYVLKYKIELLLDMLAVSNADLDTLEKEFEVLSTKTTGQSQINNQR